MKKIILTGGGTAGHVTPNLALVPLLKEEGYDILYVGSKNGIEKEIVEKAGIPYTGVSSGKLRRYHSVENFKDPFRIQKGFHEALAIMKDYQPDIVFSKGGFVSVPVVVAAKRMKIPAITHEADMSVGLANKLNLPAVKALCCNFPETVVQSKSKKAVYTGCPIRAELLTGSAEAARAMTGFVDDKPVLMIIGGSLGSVAVNNAVRDALDDLQKTFYVLHLCGRGNLDESLANRPGYVQYEYINEELKDLFALADVVISRAGANAICELVALKKPNLLIPLPSASSRGDQLLNAESFEKQGFSDVLLQENITRELLVSKVLSLYENRQQYIDKMSASSQSEAARNIVDLIIKYSK